MGIEEEEGDAAKHGVEIKEFVREFIKKEGMVEVAKGNLEDLMCAYRKAFGRIDQKTKVEITKIVEEVTKEGIEQNAPEDVETEDQHVRWTSPPIPKKPNKAAQKKHVEGGHCPYQPWCRICVQTRGKSSPHRTHSGKQEAEVATMAMDFCFPDGRGPTGEREGEVQPDLPDQQGASKVNTVLVVREAGGGPTLCLKVPKKGASHQAVVKYIGQWIRGQGHAQIILKGDSEASIKQLQDEIRNQNRGMVIVPENSPAYDSASNGVAERAVQEVEGYIRTIKAEIEEKAGITITHNMPIYHWIVRHVGTILSQVKVHGCTGLTSYERRRGKPSTATIIPMGEHVMYQLDKKARNKKSEDRFKAGVYLGIAWRSNEILIGTSTGIKATRCIRRRPEGERYNAEAIMDIKGTPVDPDAIEIDEETAPDEAQQGPPAPPAEPPPDEGPKVRRFQIRREDVEKHGSTEGCPGCRALIHAQWRAPHTAECRARFEKAMAEDPATASRIRRDRERAEEGTGAKEDDEEDTGTNEDDEPVRKKRREDHDHDRQQGDDNAQAKEDDQKEADDEGESEDESEKESNSSSSSSSSSSSGQSDVVETQAKKRRLQVVAGPAAKVAEIYSPPRVSDMAEKMGLVGGAAMDLRTGWDFSKLADRKACREKLEVEKPDLVVGSPECRMFSALQEMNPCKDGAEWKKAYTKAINHIMFCLEVYQDQINRGAYFLHEHPLTAKSWKLKAIQRMLDREDVISTVIDMCQYGMTAQGEYGEQPAKKPTRMMTNSPWLAEQLKRRCRGEHIHTTLVGGKAGPCARYPPGLCRAICKGIQKQKEEDERLAARICSMLDTGDLMSMSGGEDWFWDDSKGGWLDARLVMEARKKELEYVRRMNIYQKVPREEASQGTDRSKPIKVRWVDTNKGTKEQPNVRSRIVAMEFRRDHRPDLYSATPPLEVFKLMLAMVAGSAGRSSEMSPMCAMHIDVSRAYFHAPVCRRTYIELPEEDKMPGEETMIGRLNASLYGTRDAQLNWEKTYVRVLEGMGFVRGVAVPCTFSHSKKKIQVAVHGDDFLVIGHEWDLHWVREKLAGELEIKSVIIGPGEHQDKEITLLNRKIRWGRQGIEWEADRKHAEQIVSELGLDSATGVGTPCIESIKELGVRRKEGRLLEGDEITRYRRLVAIANFLAADRADLQYCVRCLCQGMSGPSEDDMKALKHLGRYLKRQPRLVLFIPWGGDCQTITVQSDSDWAGDRMTRRSTSGGAIFIGNALVKSWAREQTTVAQSSGESELYAANLAAREGLGMKSIAEGFGYNMKLVVEIDAAAAEGMMQRRGLGKMRHLEVAELWGQQAIAEGKFALRRVRSENNASDLGTKPLDRGCMEKHLVNMGYFNPICGQAGGASRA